MAHARFHTDTDVSANKISWGARGGRINGLGVQDLMILTHVSPFFLFYFPVAQLSYAMVDHAGETRAELEDVTQKVRDVETR